MNSRFFGSPFLKLFFCGANDNTFHEKFLRASDITLSRSISAGHAAEETGKNVYEILQFQSMSNLHKTNKLHKPRLGHVQKLKKIRDVNFEMAPIPGEKAHHKESRV